MICDLCKKEFDPNACDTNCQKGCGSTSKCHGVRCPYCFYEMLVMPKWYQGLTGFFNREKAEEKPSAPGAGISLIDLEVNRAAKVVRIETYEHHQLHKLTAIGTLPGTEVVLIQKFPAYVLQMGFSRFSIDAELASCIFVEIF